MERVHLDLVYGKTVIDAWRTGWAADPYTSTVRVGRLADGRWYTERTGRSASRRDKMEGACVYAATARGERLARDTARRWMRSVPGEWKPRE